jgi:hypothetical protein
MHNAFMGGLHYNRGHAVVQLVEPLHYKQEGRRFDFQCCQRKFSLT